MNRFTQIHMLTSYPPSNLNRDDLGRPKSATFGGKERLRISSQSLKRAWRTSDVFQDALSGHLGVRTTRLPEKYAFDELSPVLGEKKAEEIASSIAANLGSLSKKHKNRTGQMVMLSAEEITRVVSLVSHAKAGEEISKDDYKNILGNTQNTVDIAMFGRMLADTPKHNVDGAIMVSHALTTHSVTIEDDFFTAVDDLNDNTEDAGAGHMGVLEFSEGLFYIYVCVDNTQMLKNLHGNQDLVNRGVAALLEAMATVSPSGKQRTFAALGRADYLMVERGNKAPRTLARAFLDAIRPPYLSKSIGQLERLRDAMDEAYGPCAESREVMKIDGVDGVEGSLASLKEFIQVQS